VVIVKPKPLWVKYLALSKARLGLLVVTTTVAGYLAGPFPLDLLTLFYTTVGTSLAIASANSINQYIEVENDILMRRTANRVLPTGELSLNHALAFGVITGITGSTILALCVNGIAAGLALSNILLYTLVYTPMKRVHWINTWIGSVVGAIPPLIGWAANTGGIEAGGWLLFYVLFIWQIPHFLALSWNLKNDYGRAGYRMLINANPEKVALLTHRYCYYLLPVGPVAMYIELATWPFAVLVTLLSLWLIYQTWGFKKSLSSVDARKIFKQTLLYLPLLLIFLLIFKQTGYRLKPDEE